MPGKPFYFLGPKRFIGSLQDERYAVETRVCHKTREEVFSKLTLPYWGVTVHTRPQPLFGIVEMHPTEIAESYDPVEFAPYGIITLRGTEIIPGGERMTRVHTHTDTRLVFDTLYDSRQMFEPEAEV